ncbi:MAG TPA: GTP 3',8-cyclase MoaA [Pirellulales bacterium]|jgi:cyclic pyranopterin phosphate synthase|nr:GTP 3',8-cyclase MoaA [Pirellulales bacterium]
MPVSLPLLDTFGRVHSDLRISVTDRCNIRCFYCMPADNVEFARREDLLTFDEIERFVRIAATLGVRKLRLTGGEPLVRPNLGQLIQRLVAIPGIDDVALTTNGILLAEQAAQLKAAGLHRLNISLDTLDAATFLRIARRPGLDRVLAGIEAARQAGFQKIRLNAVAIRGMTETEVVPLARYSLQRGLELRFIEFMPLDADHAWDNSQVLSGAEILSMLEAELGRLDPLPVSNPSQPATDFRLADGSGTVGFINPVTEPFCGDCNRLRLTAEGQLRNCLFSTEEWDLRPLLRGGADDAAIIDQVRVCVAAKRAGHGINSDHFLRPTRPMFQIGG